MLTVSLTVWIALEVLGSKWRKTIGGWFQSRHSRHKLFQLIYYFFPWFPSSVWPQVLEYHSWVWLRVAVVFLLVLAFNLLYSGITQGEGERGG